MGRTNPLENPFDLNKASDFSDSEIAEQWVDMAELSGGLLSILKPKLRMPMLLLGGKGSGKTHLMRYCSAAVQAARRNGDLSRAILEDEYLGIYIRADALNTDKFAGGGQSEEYWARIFSTYFELWLAASLLGVLANYLESSGHEVDERKFVSSASGLFDADVAGSFESVSSLTEYLTKLRKHIDLEVNNCLLRNKSPDIEITFSPGALVFGIPEVIAKFVTPLNKILIVYLIDEVENFTLAQQRFLNSLIRYRRGNATIKLGARLYGIKTYDTLGSGEPIKRDAEYERVELDALLREQTEQYRGFARRLVLKRLYLSGHETSVDKADIDSFFAVLDNEFYWKSVEADLGVSPSATRPFHKSLLSDLSKVNGISKEAALEIVSTLSFPKHLFLDKAATFFFRKYWPESVEQAYDMAKRTSQQAQALFSGERADGAELQGIIAHFGSDILAQLYHDYRRRVPYTGFATMVDLSQGIVRNLLTNLKHIYRRSQFAGEAPFAGGLISVKSQTDGVRDGAAWFWEDAQPSSGGLQVRDAVESLAVLFRTVRLSHSPSECDLCTFSVTSDQLTNNSLKTLEVAENWSYLIHCAEGRRNKNRRSVDRKYQLGPMLAPRWEVSEHRRGSIELTSEIANAILDPTKREALPQLMRRRLQRMLAPPSPQGEKLL